MDWNKTIKRIARKRGLTLKQISQKAGYQDDSNFIRRFSDGRTATAAQALEIPEELVLLEALRDSRNLPDQTRRQLIKIIDEFRPSAGVSAR